MKKIAVALLSLALLTSPSFAADAGKEPIKIGGVFSYSAMPDWTKAGQNGMKMAVDEWNEKGGYQGRKVEILLRDDQGSPATAVQVSQDLIFRDHVVALTGVSFTNASLAIGELADREKIPYVPVWCWKDTCTDRPNKMVFALDSHPSEMVRPLAKWAAKQPIARWGAIIPTEEFSRTAMTYFEAELKKLRPDAKVVDVRTYQYGTNPFGQLVSILRQKKVEGVFNSVGADELPKYLRAARKVGFDKQVTTIHAYAPPEALKPLKGEAPVDWYVLAAYPGEDLKTPENQVFVEAYRKQFGEAPGDLAFATYLATKFVLGAISKAGADKSTEIAAALRGLSIATPVGDVTMNAATQRSDLGYWYGTTAVQDGRSVLRDFYRDATDNTK